MCWNTGVSTAMAVGGFALTVVSARRGDPKALWMTLGFFSVMEVVQALSYPVIGQCGHPLNRGLTMFSFGHITLHPFFFNALALAMLPDAAREKIQYWVYALCAVATAYTIAQLAPLTGNGTCAPHRMMCGQDFCTVPGNFHLAWEIPLNSWGNGLATHENWLVRQFKDGMLGYGLSVFVLPLLYGAWRITVFHFLTGVIAVRMITADVNEQPAIWCLMSAGVAAMIIFTPLRRALASRGPIWLSFDRSSDLRADQTARSSAP